MKLLIIVGFAGLAKCRVISNGSYQAFKNLLSGFLFSVRKMNKIMME